MGTLFRKLGVDDTPVWMLWKDPETREYEAILVAWYNFDQYNEHGFLSLKTFGTEKEAKDWLVEFWDAMWRLG